MTAGRVRRLLAALLAALLVASAGVAGAGGVAAAQTQEDDGPEPADEVYVEEDGDAVLVYESDSSSEDLQHLEFGLDVSRNLMHMLVVGNATGAEDVEANATAVLTPDGFVGNGSVAATRPEALKSLSVDVTGARTTERAEADLDVGVTVSNEEMPAARLLESARTSGELSVSGDRITSSGELTADLATPMGEPASHEFTIAETDGRYTVTADQSYVVREYAADRWETREAARQTLEAQYASVARSLGGTAEITLDSYAFENASRAGTYRLDVAYTVTYEGVEDGVAQQLGMVLASSEETDLTREEARAIGQRVTELTVEEIAVSYRQGQGSVDASYSLALDNYDEVVMAGLDAARSLRTDDGAGETFQERLEAFRARFEARRAADLTETYTWDGSLSTTRSALTFQLAGSYRTQNWGAYVDELESRNVPFADVTFEFHAATEGERVTADAAVEVGQRELVDGLAQGALGLLESEEADNAQARELIEAFRSAGFEKSRMDVGMRDGRVRIEAGAAFENMSAFEGALESTDGIPPVTSVVGRTENGSTTTYVRASGAFPENATEEDVRSAAYVDEDTTVHLPGTWNRSFPEMDARGASEYLGLPFETPTSGDGGDGGDGATDGNGPGFGAAAAALAVALAALLVHRRD